MKYQEIQKYIQNKTDSNLSPYATKNSLAIRKKNIDNDVRLPFSIDRDRIIYCGAYRRSTGKTQVLYFANMKDEQISNRILHIQYVSQIARTIGTALSLNIDLIEAAALGHDLGHTPFGHDGETILSRICEKYGIGKFHHNLHSLYIVDEFSYHGKGMNLTFQVRDAILSHNGEIHEKQLRPDRNKNEDSLQDYVKRMKNDGNIFIAPATLEGCAIRISDTISYIGADIEDAIRLGIITRDDLPKEPVKLLGNNNGKIVDTLVKDIIVNSFENDYLAFSGKISNALLELKKFNYKRIYKSDKLHNERKKVEKGFQFLFDNYLEDLESGSKNSDIYIHFLNSKNEEYQHKVNNYEKIRDFMASMTDRYFRKQLEKTLIPLVN